MLTVALLLSLGMLLYGIIRFAVAKYRRRENATIHILWIPCAAVFFAISVTLTVLVNMA